MSKSTKRTTNQKNEDKELRKRHNEVESMMEAYSLASISVNECAGLLVEKIKYFKTKFLEEDLVDKTFGEIFKRAELLNKISNRSMTIYSGNDKMQALRKSFIDFRPPELIPFGETFLRYISRNAIHSNIITNYKVLTSDAVIGILNDSNPEIDSNTMFNVGLECLIEDLEKCENVFYGFSGGGYEDFIKVINAIMSSPTYSDIMKFKFIVGISLLLVYMDDSMHELMDTVNNVINSNLIDSLMMIPFISGNKIVKYTIVKYVSEYQLSFSANKNNNLMFNSCAAFIYLAREYDITIPNNIPYLLSDIPVGNSDDINLFSFVMALCIKGENMLKVCDSNAPRRLSGLLFVMLYKLRSTRTSDTPSQRLDIIDMMISTSISEKINIEELDINVELRKLERDILREREISIYTLFELTYNIIGTIPLITAYVNNAGDNPIDNNTDGSLAYFVNRAYNYIISQPIHLLPIVYNTYKSKKLCRKLLEVFMIASKNNITIKIAEDDIMEDCKNLVSICLMDRKSDIEKILIKKYGK